MHAVLAGTSDLEASLATARPDGRKEHIHRVAARLFAANGYHATGMRELCEAVGLGKGALYHHIGSKEELLYDIVSAHVTALVAYGNVVLDMDVGPDEKFRRLSRRLMRTVAEKRAEVTVFFRDFANLSGPKAEAVIELRHSFEDIWERILLEGEEAGVFRHEHRVVVKAILGMHNHSHLWLRPDGELTPEELSDILCDFAFFGLSKPMEDQQSERAEVSRA